MRRDCMHRNTVILALCLIRAATGSHTLSSASPLSSPPHIVYIFGILHHGLISTICKFGVYIQVVTMAGPAPSSGNIVPGLNCSRLCCRHSWNYFFLQTSSQIVKSRSPYALPTLGVFLNITTGIIYYTGCNVRSVGRQPSLTASPNSHAFNRHSVL